MCLALTSVSEQLKFSITTCIYDDLQMNPNVYTFDQNESNQHKFACYDFQIVVTEGIKFYFLHPGEYRSLITSKNLRGTENFSFL